MAFLTRWELYEWIDDDVIIAVERLRDSITNLQGKKFENSTSSAVHWRPIAHNKGGIALFDLTQIMNLTQVVNIHYLGWPM